VNQQQDNVIKKEVSLQLWFHATSHGGGHMLPWQLTLHLTACVKQSLPLLSAEPSAAITTNTHDVKHSQIESFIGTLKCFRYGRILIKDL